MDPTAQALFLLWEREDPARDLAGAVLAAMGLSLDVPGPPSPDQLSPVAAAALAAARALDGGAAFTSVATGSRTALTLYEAHASWAVGVGHLEADQGQDAAIRALGLGVVAATLGAPTWLASAAGRALVGWFAAIDVALAFAAEGELAPEHLPSEIVFNFGDEAADRLSPLLGPDAVSAGRAALADLLPAMDAAARIAARAVDALAKAVQNALRPLTGNAREDLVAEAEALPIYGALVARLIAELREGARPAPPASAAAREAARNRHDPLQAERLTAAQMGEDAAGEREALRAARADLAARQGELGQRRAVLHGEDPTDTHAALIARARALARARARATADLDRGEAECAALGIAVGDRSEPPSDDAVDEARRARKEAEIAVAAAASAVSKALAEALARAQGALVANRARWQELARARAIRQSTAAEIAASLAALVAEHAAVSVRLNAARAALAPAISVQPTDSSQPIGSLFEEEMAHADAASAVEVAERALLQTQRRRDASAAEARTLAQTLERTQSAVQRTAADLEAATAALRARRLAEAGAHRLALEDAREAAASRLRERTEALATARANRVRDAARRAELPSVRDQLLADRDQRSRLARRCAIAAEDKGEARDAARLALVPAEAALEQARKAAEALAPRAEEAAAAAAGAQVDASEQVWRQYRGDLDAAVGRRADATRARGLAQQALQSSLQAMRALVLAEGRRYAEARFALRTRREGTGTRRAALVEARARLQGALGLARAARDQAQTVAAASRSEVEAAELDAALHASALADAINACDAAIRDGDAARIALPDARAAIPDAERALALAQDAVRISTEARAPAEAAHRAAEDALDAAESALAEVRATLRQREQERAQAAAAQLAAEREARRSAFTAQRATAVTALRVLEKRLKAAQAEVATRAARRTTIAAERDGIRARRDALTQAATRRPGVVPAAALEKLTALERALGQSRELAGRLVRGAEAAGATLKLQHDALLPLEQGVAQARADLERAEDDLAYARRAPPTRPAQSRIARAAPSARTVGPSPIMSATLPPALPPPPAPGPVPAAPSIAERLLARGAGRVSASELIARIQAAEKEPGPPPPPPPPPPRAPTPKPMGPPPEDMGEDAPTSPPTGLRGTAWAPVARRRDKT